MKSRFSPNTLSILEEEGKVKIGNVAGQFVGNETVFLMLDCTYLRGQRASNWENFILYTLRGETFGDKTFANSRKLFPREMFQNYLFL